MSKENQDEITRLNESGIMSKFIEEEKKRMISWLKEDIKGLEHQVGKSSRYSNNNIWVNYIYNINENNVVHKDKITIQGEVTSINEGDEISNENNKTYVVAIEDDIKMVVTSH